MIYFPIVAFAFAFIYFMYPRYESKFKIRPKIVIETESGKGIKKTQTFIGYSAKNAGIVTDPDSRWVIYEFEWRFKLVIRNNSEINAYELELLQKKEGPKIEFQGEINHLKALKAHEEIILPFQIVKVVECQGKNREAYFNNYPDVFESLSLILLYKNPKGKRFQSIYFFKRNYTSYASVSNRIIKKNWQ